MTIDLELYQKLNDQQKMLYLLERGDKMVNIYSGEHGAYWRSNKMGYTYKLAEAGRYTLSDAIAASQHCGPEKQIKYHFVTDQLELPPVKQWEGVEELLADPLVNFDKYVGIHRSSNAGNVK